MAKRNRRPSPKTSTTPVNRESTQGANETAAEVPADDQLWALVGRLVSHDVIIRERDFRDTKWWTILSIFVAVVVSSASLLIGYLGWQAAERATKVQEQAFERESFSIPPAFVVSYAWRSSADTPFLNERPIYPIAQEQYTITNAGGTAIDTNISAKMIMRVCVTESEEGGRVVNYVMDTCRDISLRGFILDPSYQNLDIWDRSQAATFQSNIDRPNLWSSAYSYCFNVRWQEKYALTCDISTELIIYRNQDGSGSVTRYSVGNGYVNGPYIGYGPRTDDLELDLDWSLDTPVSESDYMAQVIDLYRENLVQSYETGTPVSAPLPTDWTNASINRSTVARVILTSVP